MSAQRIGLKVAAVVAFLEQRGFSKNRSELPGEISNGT